MVTYFVQCCKLLYCRYNLTPLHHAAMRGNTEVVRLLLASTQRSDIDNPDIQGSSALHIAATYDNKDVVEILLEKGANPR